MNLSSLFFHLYARLAPSDVTHLTMGADDEYGMHKAMFMAFRELVQMNPYYLHKKFDVKHPALPRNERQSEKRHKKPKYYYYTRIVRYQ